MIILLMLLSLGLSANAQSQLVNPSFEQIDTLQQLRGWSLSQGKQTLFSALTINGVPLVAAHGNYFILLAPDTSTPQIKPAILRQQSAFISRPQQITLEYFYIPQALNQRAGITLMFSKWNAGRRDTILYLNDTLPFDAPDGRIPIKWNQYGKTLTPFYRSTLSPDTALLQLTNETEPATGKDVKLFIDDIRFGPWALGLTYAGKHKIRAYPNPANHVFYIRYIDEEVQTVQLIDVLGKMYSLPIIHVADEIKADVSTIENGMYWIKVNKTMIGKPIIIAHD
jgi:hypothetical protein